MEFKIEEMNQPEKKSSVMPGQQSKPVQSTDSSPSNLGKEAQQIKSPQQQQNQPEKKIEEMKMI